jgi:hypothetical protein
VRDYSGEFDRIIVKVFSLEKRWQGIGPNAEEIGANSF